MAGRYVDGWWEEDPTPPQLGQNVGGWVNQGMSPDQITDSRFHTLLKQIGFDPAKHYRFDPQTGYHLYSPEVSQALSGLATQVSQQDKKGGFGNAIQGFFDKGGGVGLMAAGIMGPTMAAGGMGSGGLAGLGEVGAGMGGVGGATGLDLGISGLGNSFAGADLAALGGETFGGTGATGALSGGGMVSGGSGVGLQGLATEAPWGPEMYGMGGDTGLDLGIKGLGESSVTTFGQPFGSPGQGSGLFSSLGSMGGSGGGGFVDSILSGLKTVLGGSNLTGGDLLKTGVNYLLNQRTAGQYGDAATEAANRANSLNDPQRQQYQQQLSQLLSNPTEFYNTNPVVRGQLDLARQQFEANTGKMGTGGTQFNNYLKNVQNVASSTYNDQANLLSTLGGFNQGAGYSGNVYANLADKGIQQQQQSQLFFPDLMKKVFGGMDNKQQESPSGTNIISMA